MNNPRWPHTLQCFVPAKDERGNPVFDKEGNAKYGPMTFEKVLYDSRYNPIRGADGKFKTETVTEMPWGYRTSTGGISASGEVIHTDFKISCPMFLTDLPEGTVLRLTDYTHTFEAVVQKCTTYNWGTNIWFKNPGNNGKVSAEE